MFSKKGDHKSGLLTIKDCPLPVYFCVLQVGIFNGWVIVWHKNLLEELNGESTLPHAAISNHHQLVCGEVFAGNSAGSHVSTVLNLLEKETISDYLLVKNESNVHEATLTTCLRSEEELHGWEPGVLPSMLALTVFLAHIKSVCPPNSSLTSQAHHFHGQTAPSCSSFTQVPVYNAS